MTAVGSTQSIMDTVARSMRQFPDRLALQAAGSSVDYAALESKVAALQQSLRASGLPENRLVGVLTGDDPRCYAAILAILACGCAYVPISHRNPPHRNRVIVSDAGLQRIVAHRAHPALDDAARGRCKVVRSDQADPVVASLQIDPVEPSDLAYLFYTSGSTGKPKGVPITHRNLNAFMAVMLDPEQFEFSRDDRFLQMFDLTFDLSVASFLIPLCLGAPCCVVAEHGIKSVNAIATLRDHDITVALMVPSVLFHMQRYFDEVRLPALRYSQFCGEALPESLLADWAACVPNARLQNLYGPTEATIACLRYDWQPDAPAPSSDNGIVAIGKAFPGMEAFVVDADGARVRRGEKGELCLAGPQVTNGYWRDTTRTSDAFLSRQGMESSAYRTGDVCFMNGSGNLVFCGRIDHQVKIDGYRVELGEIEHHARQAARGVNAAVTATVGNDGGVSLTLYLERAPVGAAAIRTYLAARLPPHMQPGRIENLDRMPLNASGKVDRGALSKRASGR